MGLFKWFKSKGENGESVPPQPAPQSPTAAPSRSIKTVVPNTMKPLSIREGAGEQSHDLTPGFGLDKPLVPLVDTNSPPPPAQLEKDIYLEIGDFVERIPREYLGNYQPHLKRRVAFRLGDIFADLAKGRATIPLQTLYHFCPEIFCKQCIDTEPIPISLPLQKLVEQVGAFETREDQIMPEQYTLIDTPIARVAAEDGGAPIPITQSGAPTPSLPKEAAPQTAEAAKAPLPSTVLPTPASKTSATPPAPLPLPIQTANRPSAPVPPPIPTAAPSPVAAVPQPALASAIPAPLAPPISAVPPPLPPSKAPIAAVPPPLPAPPIPQPAPASTIPAPVIPPVPVAAPPIAPSIPQPAPASTIPAPVVPPIAPVLPPSALAKPPIAEAPTPPAPAIPVPSVAPTPPALPTQPPLIKPPPIPLPGQPQIAPPTVVRVPTAQPSAQAPVPNIAMPPTVAPPSQPPLVAPSQAKTQIPSSAPASHPAPLSGGKRPPATVRASFAGGKITLRASVPVQQSAPSSGPSSLLQGQTTPIPRVGVPIPSSVTQPSPQAKTQQQEKRITGRIKLPPLRLQGETSGKPTLVSPPVAPSSFVKSSEAETGSLAAPRDDSPVISAPPRVLPVAPQSSSPSPYSPPPAQSVKAEQLAFAAPPRSPSPAASGSSGEHGTMIHLSLAAVLRSLAPHFFTGSIPDLEEDLKVALPFDIIEPQLAEGRVAIPAQVLINASPESIRSKLSFAEPNGNIPLPLQQILQSLPANALSLRRDQYVDKPTEEYDTPFSVKMKEDEARFAQQASLTRKEPVASQSPSPASHLETETAPAVDIIAETKQPDPTPYTEPVLENKPIAAQPTEHPQITTPVPKPTAVTTEPSIAKPDLVPTPVVGRDAGAKPPPEKQPSIQLEAKKTQKIAADDLSSQTPVFPPQVSSKKDVHPPLADSPSVAESPIEASKPGTPTAIDPALSKAAVEPPKVVAQQESAPQAQPIAAPAIGQPRQATPPKAEVKTAEASKETKLQKRAALVPPTPLSFTPHIAAPKAPIENEEFDTSELQALFMTEEHLDAKNIVKHTCHLPGISGCLLMFADGLPIAGNFPEDFSQDAFGAIIPRFFGKVQDYSRDLRLGSIETVTIHTEKGPVSLYMHGNVCMALLHSKSRFLPGVREKLTVVVREVSRMYAHPPKH